MHENMDLTNIVTPVSAVIFNKLLKEAGYEESKRLFLFEGFSNGFPLGYENPRKIQVTSRNLKLVVGDEVDLWNKVMKEVGLLHFAGPFESIPEQFKNDFIQSPIGLVPKDGGKDLRLIFHLSHPRKLQEDGSSLSVNGNTLKSRTKVKYPDFSEAIVRCLKEGFPCFLSKSDNRSAFRNLGILPAQWRYLILKAKCPLDGKEYFLWTSVYLLGRQLAVQIFKRCQMQFPF